MVPLRDAATVMLVRDAPAGAQGDADPGGLEVFMLRRNLQSDFVGGAYVFPGGGVDDHDRHRRLESICRGRDDADASERLGIEAGGLAYWVAAIRESFEEAGVLLAYGCDGEMIRLDQPEVAARFVEHRRAVDRGERRLVDVCADEQLQLAVDGIHYFSHWITPEGAPRRYDTRFFVARAPRRRCRVHDDHEVIANLWVRPADALGPSPRRRVRADLPDGAQPDGARALRQRRTRSWRPPRPSTACRPSCPASWPTRAGASASSCPATRATTIWCPRICATVFRSPRSAAKEVAMPRRRAPEVIDPDAEAPPPEPLVPGVARALSPLVRRILAPNPSKMTGPGTNTYLVGIDEIAVIDPGPDVDDHLDAIAGCGGDRIRWIVCTHTHPDHAPGAAGLKARTGAEVLAWDSRDGLVVDRKLRDGDRIEATEFRLTAVHTPGHASNHLCYLLEEEHVLFSGDHVMEGSTVVISPPDGNMIQYLASLERVRGLRLKAIAPGHGRLIEDPYAVLDDYLAHRRAREQQIYDLLAVGSPSKIDPLVEVIYADVDPELHPVARRTVHAHLVKLVKDGKVKGRSIDGNWSVVA